MIDILSHFNLDLSGRRKSFEASWSVMIMWATCCYVLEQRGPGRWEGAYFGFVDVFWWSEQSAAHSSSLLSCSMNCTSGPTTCSVTFLRWVFSTQTHKQEIHDTHAHARGREFKFFYLRERVCSWAKQEMSQKVREPLLFVLLLLHDWLILFRNKTSYISFII